MALGEVVTGAEQLAAVEATPTLSELFGGAVARMRARGRGEERKLPLPWAGLARLYSSRGGLEVLRPGVHVIVGGTGSGKTQVALSIALEAARAGAPVTYVGLELDEVGIIARLMGIEAARGKAFETAFDVASNRWAERWSSLDWPDGDVSRRALDEVAERFEAVLPAVGRMRLRLGGGRSGFDAEAFGRVLDEARADATKERPALVVLDFLQLLGANPANRDDKEIRTRIARASYLANNATLDGRLAVVLVSATGRANYDLDALELGKLYHPSKLVGTGKESGEIEYSAASVLVLGRLGDKQPSKCTEPAGGWRAVRLACLAKGRHGGMGWAMLGFDGGAFYDIDADGTLLEAAVKAAKSGEKAEKSGGKEDDDLPASLR